MRIRDYAKAAGFEVVGKLTLNGKWSLQERCYQDQAGNLYLVNTVIGGARIIPKTKKEDEA